MRTRSSPGLRRLLGVVGRAAPGRALAVSALLVAVLPSADVRAQPAQPDPETGELIRVYRGVMGYRDDRLRAVAASYYFPHEHDPRWLAIELEITNTSSHAMTFERGDVHVAQPDGARVPMISQRTWRREGAGMMPLLLQMRGGVYRFPSWGWIDRGLRFFVVDGRGTRQDLVDVLRGRGVRGTIFFDAPAGRWASGNYELVVGGEIGVRIPFEIE